MPELIEIFWIFDFFSTFLGLFLNGLLIFTIIKTSSSTKMLPKYSYSFLTTSSFDFLVALVEMMTAHQVKLKDGIIFVMPQGVERQFPSLSIVFFSLHCFVGYNSLFIIPAMYRFRYSIMREASNDNSSLRGLLRDTILSVSTAVFLGLCTSVAVVQASQRSLEDYYLPMLAEESETVRQTVLYVVDMKDSAACISAYFTCIFGNIATFLAGYYIYKSWKHMNSSVVELSANARSMQVQFSRSLIAQTLTTFCFAILPVALMSSALIFHVDYKFLGTGLLLPFNSMPAINALVTMYLIRVYRRQVLKMFGCATKKVGENGAESGFKPAPSSFAIS